MALGWITLVLVHLSHQRNQTAALLLISPPRTGFTLVPHAGSIDSYYSVEYEGFRKDGFEVVDIGSLRLIKRGYEGKETSSSGSVVIPNERVIPGMETLYATEVRILGERFRIEDDHLILGNHRLPLTASEPLRLKVNRYWSPVDPPPVNR